MAPHETLPSSATPHGLGNHEWAIAPDKSTHLCIGEKLSKVADAWHKEYGHRIAIDPIVAAAEKETHAQKYTCADLFGSGYCVSNFDADELVNQRYIKDTLNLLQRLHKSRLKKMCLRIDHHLDVPTDEDYPPCIFVLSLCATYKIPEKQKFNYCRCIGPPIPGSALQLERLRFSDNAAPPPRATIPK